MKEVTGQGQEETFGNDTVLEISIKVNNITVNYLLKST